MRISSRRRRERRERLRSVKSKGSAAGSFHQPRRSGRGKGKGDAEPSLKKRNKISSHLRQRGRKAPEAAANESPSKANTSPDCSPKVKPTKEKKESFSSRFFSNPAIRWTEEERDLGAYLGKQKYKVSRVFDPLSDSWVVKYDIVSNPMAPGSNGIPAKIICNVCGKPDHLSTTCALTFRYPPHAPDFNTEVYQLVCQCGSNEIVPGRWSCSDCQPNSGLRVEAKELPPLIDYDNPNPDPSSLTPWVIIPSKGKRL